MKARRERRPWKMRWIVLAIVVFVLFYTWVNIRYRKAGPAFRPYQDLKDRAGVVRLLGAGFRRMTLEGSSPPEGPSTLIRTADEPARLEPVPGGIPAGLGEKLIDSPVLPDRLSDVEAAASTFAGTPYTIRFGCTLPDDRQNLSGATLYGRAGAVILVPTFETLPDGLQLRTRQQDVQVTLPAGTLHPGKYRFVLAGASQGQGWTLIVH